VTVRGGSDPVRGQTPWLTRRLGLDRFELATLVALAGFSLVTLAALATKGRPLSGADGLLAIDQLQYLTWIREASHHVLIGNRFDLAPGSRSALHPGVLISALVHRLGASIPLSYLLWKPVAVGLTFAGTLAYVRRLLPGTGRRRVALVLVLFSVAPMSAFVAWSGWGGKPREYTFDFISGEMWSGQYLWGYLFTAIAVFLMPLVLLGLERWWTGGRPARLLAWCCAGGLFVMWLQPWQGATLGIVVAAVALIRLRRDGERPPLAGLAAFFVALGVPAIYYLALGHFDAAWELAGEMNKRGAMPEWRWPWWAMALTVAPLAVPALLAYRLPAPSWQDVAVRVWPWAALLMFLVPFGTFPYHSFQGLTIPLGILAVQGAHAWWPEPRPWLIAGVLLVMTVPGLVHKGQVFHRSVQAGGDPFWVFPGEVRALEALAADPRPGGVLAPSYAGYMTPYRTGREVWVGPFSWTPHWNERQQQANDLFEGRLGVAAERAVVRRSRARFLFADCRPLARERLARDLAPMLAAVRRYGCAWVFELRFRPEMARAAGPPDA
jgi:hypothetical protein